MHVVCVLRPCSCYIVTTFCEALAQSTVKQLPCILVVRMVTIIALVLVSMLPYSVASCHKYEHKEKVLVLSKKIQEVFFVPENSQTLYNMREVFFPSSNYRFWQPDNTEIIDIEICVNIISTDLCLATGNVNTTGCWMYRWTDSYFLNLLDIRQLYTFELLTSATLFGTIAHGHCDRKLNIALNLSCEDLGSDTDDDIILGQALVQFLSWVKLYAQSLKLPTFWEGKYQGYVIRKFDYNTVDLFHFDDLSEVLYNSTLFCFILFNLLTTYLLMSNASLINTRLVTAAGRQGYGRHITKGFTIALAVLVPTYIIGLTVISCTSSTLTLSHQCEKTQDWKYSCVPESEFEKEHKKQVWSLVASMLVKLTAVLLYALCSMYVVKTTKRRGIVFQSKWMRCIEVYLLWSVLAAIHIGIALAGIPILIFTILIPMYTVFFMSSWITGLGILALPFIIVFYLLDLIKRGTMSKIKLCVHTFELAFTYLIGSGVIVTLIILYFLFLTGGANMAGIKGVLFSLAPPLVISVALIIIKAKLTMNNNNNNNNKETIEMLEDEPLIGF